ncbi:MAG: DUF4332 domain-containing protein [Gemmatimonadetes bacterium]|nr:DUF4332 domain-containing protein [Gemmatimonadota bacterium]
MLIPLAATALAVAVALLIAGVDPVPTWFYVFAWYPTLVLLDALAARRTRQPPWLVSTPRRLLSLWLWSAPIWLVFEAANFRLENWYYVFLPRHPVERWAGILLSFATVAPALILAERLLAAWHVATRWRTRPFPITEAGLRGARLLGLGMLVLSLGWPHRFFPLIWGATLLLCDPYVYRRRPDLSLFADLSRGEWGRVGRLALGGLAIGVLWETYNFWARGKWIYTVPWLEELKLYEMPPVGFVGFPFFALEAWAMYHALCAAGVAVPFPHTTQANRADRVHGAGRKVVAAGAMATAFAISVLLGMERWTISSGVPRLEDLPSVTPAERAVLRVAGVSTPFMLAAREPDELVTKTNLAPARADSLVAIARLATLRGIGAEYAGLLLRLDVPSVSTLARQDPEQLWLGLRRLLAPSRKRPTATEVRVWVAAAEHVRTARRDFRNKPQ